MEMRAPKSTRLKTSRPSSSVPSGYVALGADELVSRELLIGGVWGQHWCKDGGQHQEQHDQPACYHHLVLQRAWQAAPACPTGGSQRIYRERRGRERLTHGLAHPEPWIEVGVQDVDDQVDQHENEGHQQHHRLQNRVVALIHRQQARTSRCLADRRPPQSEGAAKDVAHLHAGDRDHRDERILEHVRARDGRPSSPLARAVRT